MITETFKNGQVREIFKVLKKTTTGDEVVVKYGHGYSECFEFDRKYLTDSQWEELKSIKKGSVMAMLHSETDSIPVFGWYPNTPTE